MMTSNNSTRTAIIIGASRGLGLGLAHEYLDQEWQVVATYRDASGKDALHALAQRHPNRLLSARLDMTVPDDAVALSSLMAGRFADVLFINGGISGNPSLPIEEVGTEEFQRVMETNALAPLRLIATLRTSVRSGGVIGAMSSNMGSVSGNRGHGWELYSASKAALSQLMKSFAFRHKGDGHTYLLISPGWVRTDMGGRHAPLDVKTSVRSIVSTITQSTKDGGVYFLDYQGKTVDW